MHVFIGLEAISIFVSEKNGCFKQNGFMQLNHIANIAVPSSSGRTIAVIDPSDGKVFDEIQRSSAGDIDMAVQAARHCFDATWSQISAAERGRLLMRLAASVAGHAEELTGIEMRDCGKPV